MRGTIPNYLVDELHGLLKDRWIIALVNGQRVVITVNAWQPAIGGSDSYYVHAEILLDKNDMRGAGADIATAREKSIIDLITWRSHDDESI